MTGCLRRCGAHEATVMVWCTLEREMVPKIEVLRGRLRAAKAGESLGIVCKGAIGCVLTGASVKPPKS